MTVGKLIKELQKFPKNLNVAFRDHDNGHFEQSGSVNNVDLVDYNTATKEENWQNLKGKWVVLGD